MTTRRAARCCEYVRRSSGRARGRRVRASGRNNDERKRSRSARHLRRRQTPRRVQRRLSVLSCRQRAVQPERAGGWDTLHRWAPEPYRRTVHSTAQKTTGGTGAARHGPVREMETAEEEEAVVRVSDVQQALRDLLAEIIPPIVRKSVAEEVGAPLSARLDAVEARLGALLASACRCQRDSQPGSTSGGTGPPVASNPTAWDPSCRPCLCLATERHDGRRPLLRGEGVVAPAGTRTRTRTATAGEDDTGSEASAPAPGNRPEDAFFLASSSPVTPPNCPLEALTPIFTGPGPVCEGTQDVFSKTRSRGAAAPAWEAATEHSDRRTRGRPQLVLLSTASLSARGSSGGRRSTAASTSSANFLEHLRSAADEQRSSFDDQAEITTLEDLSLGRGTTGREVTGMMETVQDFSDLHQSINYIRTETTDVVHPQQSGESAASGEAELLIPSGEERARGPRSADPQKGKLKASKRRRSTLLNEVAMEMQTTFGSSIAQSMNTKSEKRWHTFMLQAGYALFFAIILPFSAERMTSMVLMMVFSVLVTLHVPYAIAFGLPLCVENGQWQWYSDGFWIQTVMYMLSFLDIWLSFRVAYFCPIQGELIFNRRQLAVRYARSWLVWDLLLFLPLCLANIPSLCSGHNVELSQLILLMKLYKVFSDPCVAKLSNLIRRKTQQTWFVHAQRLGSFVLILLVVVHWCSCMFHYLAMTNARYFQTTSWVTAQGLENEANVHKYIVGLYWAVCTLTTVGYGDVAAENLAERVYAIFAMSLGVTAFAYVLGSMTNLITTLNRRRNEIAMKVASMESFLKRHNLPSDLAKRVHLYSTFVIRRSMAQEDRDIISVLSDSLRTQTVLHVHREVIEKLKFFQGKPPQLVVYIMENLKVELQAPGEIIVKEGDVANEMVFIGEGLLEVWVSNESNPGSHVTEEESQMMIKASARKMHNFAAFMEKRAKLKAQNPDFDRWDVSDMIAAGYDKVGELNPGDFFGEYSCLMNRKRACTIAAIEICELYILSRRILYHALERWPELAVELNDLVEGVLGPRDGRPKHVNVVTQVERNSDRSVDHAKQWLDQLRAVTQRNLEVVDTEGGFKPLRKRIKDAISRTKITNSSKVTSGVNAVQGAVRLKQGISAYPSKPNDTYSNGVEELGGASRGPAASEPSSAFIQKGNLSSKGRRTVSFQQQSIQNENKNGQGNAWAPVRATPAHARPPHTIDG